MYSARVDKNGHGHLISRINLLSSFAEIVGRTPSMDDVDVEYVL